MLVVSTEGASLVGDVEGVDGVFDVPAEVGAHLLLFPGWRRPSEEEAAGFTAPEPKKGSRSRKT